MPFRSQYDGSPYQYANCGPAALGMVLQAYGIEVGTAELRAWANRLQGTSGYDDGVALDYLAAIAQQSGLRTEGLRTEDGQHDRQWSMSDLIREIRDGHPVITLVHFASLPAHQGSGSISDHYIVIVGVNEQGFVINDPAADRDGGYRQILRPEHLLTAWRDASLPNQAVAFLPPTGKLALAPDPRPGTGPAVPREAAGAARGSQPLDQPPRLSAEPPAEAGAPAPAPPGEQASAAIPPANPTITAWTADLRAWRRSAAAPAAPVELAKDGAGPPASPAAPPAPPVAPLGPIFAIIGVVAVGALLIGGIKGER